MDLNEAWQSSWEKVEGWVTGAVEALPNFILAVIIFIAFYALAKFVRGVVSRMLSRVSDYQAVNRMLSTLAFVTLLAIGLVVSLGVLNLNQAVTSILGAAGILGLAVGFAAQDTVANLIAGIMISIRRPLREGDLVETNDTYGVVDQVNLRATVIRTGPGQLVFVPNSEVFSNRLINYTRSGERRVDIACGVSYADDLAKAKRVAVEAIEGLDMVARGRSVDLFYNEFGGSSINFVLTFWIGFAASHREFMEAQSQAIMAIKKAFDEHDISIPFPIRTIDFGIGSGGVSLREELAGTTA